MMGLRGFEQRLERLVEGTFSRAFPSGLQPVEIARKLLRAMDAGRSLGVRGTVAPNQFDVVLSESDAEQFESFADALARELELEARGHAREESYHFVGPVKVDLHADSGLRQGALDVEARIVEGEGGSVGALVLPDGRRLALGAQPAVIGRLPDCTVPVDDARVSRRHAEIRPAVEGFVVADLGSLNGTTVNGIAVKEQVLVDGDEIRVGSATIRFEAS